MRFAVPEVEKNLLGWPIFDPMCAGWADGVYCRVSLMVLLKQVCFSLFLFFLLLEVLTHPCHFFFLSFFFFPLSVLTLR